MQVPRPIVQHLSRMLDRNPPRPLHEVVGTLQASLPEAALGSLLAIEPRSWFKMASTLPDDTAPSASLDHLEAQAAPTRPRAPPGPLGKLAMASGARLRPPQS